MSQSWVGKTIGNRYQIEALLGQGGMSAVYKATDPNLRRTVAIKMIHPHLSGDPNFVSRFKEEAAAVARLRHPNIVQVHDFNVDGDTYFMVLEYLHGETLQARLKRLNAARRHMPFDEAIHICIQLCEAAGYAHNHGLVHRDIKPANIMLDVTGQAILMDFGIVKIVGGDQHTATGATLGTAMYMSPEQIRSDRIDARADIYSLGVTLYEMLSGDPPFTADSTPSLMMMVLNDPLPDLRETRGGVSDSLLAVMHKALAKDPLDRFQSMEEMAAALRQVEAELENVSPSLAVTQGDEAWSATEETSPADHLESGKNILFATTQQDVQSEAAPSYPTPVPSSIQIDQPVRSHRTPLKTISILVLAVVVTIGLLYLNLRKPSQQLVPINRPPDPVNAQTAQNVVSLGEWETGSFIEELAFSPDGSLLGTANDRSQVFISRYRFYSGLWQVQAGSIQNYLLGHTQWVYDVAFSPNGQHFGSVSDDGSVLLWQVTDGSLARNIENETGGLSSLAFSPNNLLLAAGSGDGSVNLWQIDNGTLLRRLQEDDFSLEDVIFSPDGRLLAAASYNNSIYLWQVSDGNLEQILQGHTAPVYKVVFSPDGSLLASASEDHSVKLWRVSDGSLVRTLRGHTDPVYAVAFSPDASLLVSGAGDGKLLLWQVSNGVLLSTLTDRSEGIRSVDFSPDGHLLASGTEDGRVQFWGISEAITQDEN